MRDHTDDQYAAAARDTLKRARRMATAHPGWRLITFEPADPVPPARIQEWAKGYALDLGANKLKFCEHVRKLSTVLYMFGDFPDLVHCERCAAREARKLAKALQETDVAQCDLCGGFGGGAIVPVVMPMGAVLVRLRACEDCLTSPVPQDA